MSRSHRSSSWLLAASVAAIAVLVLAGRALVAPDPPAAAGGAPGEQLAGEPGLPAPVSAAARIEQPPRLATPAAALESSSPDEARPPPLGATGDELDENPPIEAEQPQTPAWRLEKTSRLVTLVRERIDRLETRAADAARRGDAAAAGETRILLERSRRRLDTLRLEVEALRREAGEEGADAIEESR